VDRYGIHAPNRCFLGSIQVQIPNGISKLVQSFLYRSPIVYHGPFPWGIQYKALGPTQLLNPNDISISSAIFAGLTNVTDRTKHEWKLKANMHYTRTYGPYIRAVFRARIYMCRKRHFVKCGPAGVRVWQRVKCGAKVQAQQCGAWVIIGPKNAGLPILKHYEIHFRNSQDSYAHDGLIYATLRKIWRYAQESILVHSSLKIWHLVATLLLCSTIRQNICTKSS